MSFALLCLAVALGVALLLFDLWQSRRDDRFAPEEQEPSGSVIQKGFGRAFGKGAGGIGRVASVVSIAYGVLSFPATLAPVILSVLAMQAQPLGGDGTTALISMIVAGLSMSAGIKAIRAGGLLLSDDDMARVVVARSTFYVVGWAALVLTMVSFARPPSGHVATIIYAHAGVTAAVAILLRAAQPRRDTAKAAIP
ncbi:MAG: hypothetical protein JJ863_34850 [Deltaproteobacteria bacterium]|nr:hypothetical protein [Deltaproteobacteria bacterium]